MTMRTMLRGKIHRTTVTRADRAYEGVSEGAVERRRTRIVHVDAQNRVTQSTSDVPVHAAPAGGMSR